MNGISSSGRWFQAAHLLTIISDTLSLCLSGWLAYSIRTSSLFDVHPYLLNPSEYLFLLGCAIVLWHCLLAWNGGYSDRLFLFRIDELLIQFQTANMLLILLMATTFLYHQYDYSRLILFFAWMLYVFLGSLGRQISHRIEEGLYRRGYFRRLVLLFGNNPLRALFETRVRENPCLGIDLFPIDDVEDLEKVLKEERLDDLFLFEEKVTYEKVWKIRSVSRNPAINVHLVPPFGNLYLRQINGGFFDGTILISFDSPVARKLTFFVKRCLDIIVSFAFMIILSPFFFLLAFLVKVTSRGPVFFCQNRIGRGGRPFRIYKFRSMYEEASPYALTPTEKTDPRITPLGSIIRSTGLDELPQLWNVLRGDMSLVGPRPEMPFITEKYSELEAKRLEVRPGITGLWQVYARASNLPIHTHIEYDLYYIENMSISLDLMILLDTIPTLILRTGI